MRRTETVRKLGMGYLCVDRANRRQRTADCSSRADKPRSSANPWHREGPATPQRERWMSERWISVYSSPSALQPHDHSCAEVAPGLPKFGM